VSYVVKCTDIRLLISAVPFVTLLQALNDNVNRKCLKVVNCCDRRDVVIENMHGYRKR